jgi:hypothetical protein
MPTTITLTSLSQRSLRSPANHKPFCLPPQVVSIVTAGSATGKGLFFPEGLNGNIK